MSRVFLVIIALAFSLNSVSSIRHEGLTLRGESRYLVDNSTCSEEDKYEFGGVMALTAIPVTNFFGINDYFMGHLKFGIAKNVVLFLPCLILGVALCCSCFLKFKEESSNTFKDSCAECVGTTIGCIVSLSFVVVWIVQIVMVANKTYVPDNGCGYID